MLALGGCIDGILEGDALPPGTLSVSLAPPTVVIPQGGQQAVVVRVNRTGNFDGAVTISVAASGGGGTSGITVVVGSGTTAGRATTATLTVQVAAEVAPGTYPFRVKSSGHELDDAFANLNVTVTPKPEVTLTATPSPLTIARGGVAPMQVGMARVAFTGGVALALSGNPGITAVFDQNPAVGASASALVSVAASVAPGTYSLNLEATASGLSPSAAPVSIIVTADALQILALPALSAPQAGSATTEFILNQTPGLAVVLGVEGLPAGIAASFPPGAPPGRQTMVLTVGPEVPAGTYQATLRASAPGVTDATASFTLQVTPAGINVTLAPPTVNVTAGGSVTTVLTLTRTAYAGPVTLAFTGLPSGVSVTANPVTITGTGTVLSISASALAAPGLSVVSVLATPVGLAPTAVVATPLAVNVIAPLPGGGNVTLDATRCVAPAWVAGQDGDGDWRQLLPQAGMFRFDVAAERGAYAWTRGQGVTVEYRTRAELTSGPIDICGEVPGTKSVTGTAAHGATTGAQWGYALGGGSGTSTTQQPNFTITGIRPGTHDLVVFPATTAQGLRGLLQRDLDLPDGSSLGTIDVSGTGSFLRALAQLSLSGGVEAGGTYSASMQYLTTQACTVNLLLNNNTGTMFGVPESAQRPDDFHMQTIRWSTPTGAVIASEVFHLLANRVVAWPAPMSVPTVTVVAGGYLRLRAASATVPATYTDRRQLQFTDGSPRIMTVGASAAHYALVGSSLAMPDLSGVAGWPATAPIPVGATGSWVFSAEGSNSPGALCTEGRRVITGIRRGVY